MSDKIAQQQKLRELKFAKSLADPDKTVRDRTIKALLSFLNNTAELDDIEMLKLWKALYYVMIAIL